MSDLQVMTVLGPIDAADMGVTQPHEHLLLDLFDMSRNLDLVLDDAELAAEELAAYRRAGGGTLVDTTPIGVGRDPEGLAAASRGTGVNVVMGTGWYRERAYPQYVLEMTADDLAKILIRELTLGVGDTGIRPGVIGELGTERYHITPAEERVFRAAARAHRATGATITTHTSHYGELGMDQLTLLMGEGMQPDRIIIGHQGDRRTLDLEMRVLEAGAFVQIDHIGFAEWAPDAWRADHVARLVADGFVDQVLLSSDICMRSSLHLYGGRGYDHVLKVFVPMLKERGLSDASIATMMVDNPRRALGRPASTFPA